jgi:hypothetical protein
MTETPLRQKIDGMQCAVNARECLCRDCRLIRRILDVIDEHERELVARIEEMRNSIESQAFGPHYRHALDDVLAFIKPCSASLEQREPVTRTDDVTALLTARGEHGAVSTSREERKLCPPCGEENHHYHSSSTGLCGMSIGFTACGCDRQVPTRNERPARADLVQGAETEVEAIVKSGRAIVESIDAGFAMLAAILESKK